MRAPRITVLALVGLALAAPSVTGDEPVTDKTPKVTLEPGPTDRIGQAAPPLGVARWITGEFAGWDALGDRPVVVCFWESWSSGSRKLLTDLAALHTKHGAAGLVVVAIHPAEGADAGEARVKSKAYAFACGIDHERRTAVAYEATKRVPSCHVVRAGKLVYPSVDTTIPGNLETAVVRALAKADGRDTAILAQLIAPPDISKMLDGNPLQRALGGKPVPALVAKRWVGGAPIDLAALKGKPVLLDFWGVWCGPCVAALPKLADIHAKFADKGLVVIGLHTTQAEDQLEEFLGKTKVPYPIAVDDQDQTTKAFGINNFPSIVLIDRDGVVRRARIGHASDLEAIVADLVAQAPGSGSGSGSGSGTGSGSETGSGSGSGSGSES